MTRQRKLLPFVACVVLTAGACGSESVTAVEPSIVVVSPEEETVFPDETLQLNAEVRDDAGNTLPDRAVEWSSSDADVASVDENGLVHAVRPGTTEIRAAAESAAGSAVVVVRERPPASPATSRIEVDPDSMVANGSSTASITVTLRDADGEVRARGGDAVEVATTAGGLSSVRDNDDGTYTATLTSSRTAGEVTITGRVNGEPIEDDAVVVFLPGDASAGTSTISASPSRIDGNGSDTSTITVTIRDENGNVTTGGDTVEVRVEDGGGTLSPVTDNGDGTYTATLTAPSLLATRRATIAATVNGREIEDTAEVTYLGLLASES